MTDIEQAEPAAPEPTETEVELAAQVDALNTALRDMRKERDAWRDHKQADPETEAIAGCVKALDAFTGKSTSTYSSTASNYSFVANVTGIGRILRFLAERYGVELVPHVQVMCQHEDGGA